MRDPALERVADAFAPPLYRVRVRRCESCGCIPPPVTALQHVELVHGCGAVVITCSAYYCRAQAKRIAEAGIRALLPLVAELANYRSPPDDYIEPIAIDRAWGHWKAIP